ncbi:MAG: T9SS type A sorting domain-containing protein, partial [Bacteroidetes bacterium]|nr:T9SS type A sorting domain-containing protein [Bacteroidota bacterium]
AELHISIINTLGQIVWQESFVTITETEWTQQLDIRNLQAGLYLIQIRGTQEVLHVLMVKK